MIKSEWRSELRRRLSNLNSESETVAQARRARFTTALSRVLSQRPGLWLAFSKLKDEPEVDAVVAGVQFAYPRVAHDNSMTFFASQRATHRETAMLAVWDTNRFGIQEPAVAQDSSWHEVGSNERLDERVQGVLVPALGFDRQLRRLGRGAGFYDRFLENKKCLKIGVGFAEQLVEELPTEPHDIGLDGLVTDQEVIWKVGP